MFNKIAQQFNVMLGVKIKRSMVRVAFKTCLSLVSVILCSYLFNSSVYATDYYVSTTGSNSNPGTFVLPFATVQKGVDSAIPGDFIYLRSGTYNENVVISSSGSSGNLITLTSYSSESVTINGGSGIAISTMSNRTVAYWVIDNLTIKSTNRYTTRFGWWGETPVNNITVQNCTIYGANHTQGSYNTWEDNQIDGTGYAGTDGDAGIGDAGDNTHHNTYTGNTIHDFTQYASRGIWTQGNTHDSTIENNTVYNIGGNMGQCIDLDGAGNVEWRHTVRDNTVYGCGYVGIQLENVFASTLENNKVTGVFAGIIVINYDAGAGCGTGGESNQYGDTNADNDCRGADTDDIIRQNVIWTDSGWGWGYGGIMNWYAGGLEIRGNTISAAWGSGNGGINFQGTLAETSGASIQSNIISQGTGVAICALDYASFTTDQNNLFYKSNNQNVYANGAACETDYKTLAAYQSATGKGQNSLFGSPLFTNGGIQDFSLTSSSPAIDHGVDIGLSLDFAGSVRPSGSSYDMGAYEYYFPVANSSPTISLGTVTPDPTTDTTPSITGTASDSDGTISTVEYQVDSTAGSWSACTADVAPFDSASEAFTCTSGVLVDGAHTIYVRAKDNDNDYSSNSSDAFTIDSTGPTLTSITISDSSGYTSSSTPSITIVSSGSPTHMAFSCNGGSNYSGWIVYASPTTSFSITSGATGCSTTNGSKTITAKLKDALDNESGTTSDSTYYDTQAPSVPGTPSATSPTTDTTPTWSFTASSDPGAGLAAIPYTFQWCQDSGYSGCGANTQTSSTNSYTHSVALALGTWYARVMSEDTLGNESTWSGNGSVEITAPTNSSPTISLGTVTPDPTTDTTPSITGTASDSDGTIATVEYQVDSTAGSWNACTADVAPFDSASEDFTCTSGVLADGAHAIYVRAQDNDSDYSSNSSDAFTIESESEPGDSTGPVISNVSAVHGKFTATITWLTDSAASSKVEYGKTASYGTLTLETDTSTKVTSHSVGLEDLSRCTTYHYRVRSKDVSLDETVSSDYSFKTGCSSGGGGDGDDNNDSSSSNHKSSSASKQGPITLTKINSVNIYPVVTEASTPWNTYFSASTLPWFYGTGTTDGTKVTVYTWENNFVCETVVSGGVWGCVPNSFMESKTHRIDIRYGSKLLPPFNLKIGWGYSLPVAPAYQPSVPTPTVSTPTPSPTIVNKPTPIPALTVDKNDPNYSVFGEIMKGSVKGTATESSDSTLSSDFHKTFSKILLISSIVFFGFALYQYRKK